MKSIKEVSDDAQVAAPTCAINEGEDLRARVDLLLSTYSQ